MALLLLGVWAVWTWWYIAQLSPEEASEIGMAVRVAPVTTTLVMVFFWMGGLWLTVGRTQLSRVIAHYRWRFGFVIGSVLGILLIALRVVTMRPYHWGEQDAQILLMGGAVCELLVVIAFTGGVGYRIARKLDKTAAP